jgi:hypothetical protein
MTDIRGEMAMFTEKQVALEMALYRRPKGVSRDAARKAFNRWWDGRVSSEIGDRAMSAERDDAVATLVFQFLESTEFITADGIAQT